MRGKTAYGINSSFITSTKVSTSTAVLIVLLSLGFVSGVSGKSNKSGIDGSTGCGPNGAAAVVIHPFSSDPDTAQLLRVDEYQVLVQSLEDGHRYLIPRKDIDLLEMNLDVDLQDQGSLLREQDVIELNSGKKIPAIILDLNDNWVSYTTPDSGRRHIVRQAEIYMVHLALGEVSIPYPVMSSSLVL